MIQKGSRVKRKYLKDNICGTVEEMRNNDSQCYVKWDIKANNNIQHSTVSVKALIDINGPELLIEIKKGRRKKVKEDKLQLKLEI